MKLNIKIIMILAGICVFLAIYLTQPIYAGGYFKVFEDGLIYSEGCNGEPSIWHKSCDILFEDKWYKCNPTSAGGSQAWLNPACVEIIMRSLP